MKNKSSIIKKHAKKNKKPFIELEINQSVKIHDFIAFSKSTLQSS